MVKSNRIRNFNENLSTAHFFCHVKLVTETSLKMKMYPHQLFSKTDPDF